MNDSAANRHFINVKQNLQNRALSILNGNTLKWDKQLLTLDEEAKTFLQTIFLDGILMQIITAHPADLSDLIDDLMKIYPGLSNKNSIVYKVTYNVFISHGYEDSVFNKLTFIETVGKDTCLYCNRNYIYSLDQQYKLKPEIDHFYPQAKYPFLGLTYYNLIPSCETCNGVNCKHHVDPKLNGLVNPYLINDTDFIFTYDINTIKVVNLRGNNGSVKIRFKKSIAANVTTFKLDKLYEKHTDHVLELIVKSKLKYTKKFRDYLNSYQGIRFSKNEIDRLIIGSYTSAKDIHKRPLAKLYQDIAKELKLIESN